MMTNIPDRLSTVPGSPAFDRATAGKVDKVFVDGVLIPSCRAYCISEGWAAGVVKGVWQPLKFGVVAVKMK